MNQVRKENSCSVASQFSCGTKSQQLMYSLHIKPSIVFSPPSAPQGPTQTHCAVIISAQSLGYESHSVGDIWMLLNGSKNSAFKVTV